MLPTTKIKISPHAFARYRERIDPNATAADIRKALRRCRSMSEQYGPKLNALSGQNRVWVPGAGGGPRIVFANPPAEAVFLVAVDGVGRLKIVTVLTATMIDDALRNRKQAKGSKRDGN